MNHVERRRPVHGPAGKRADGGPQSDLDHMKIDQQILVIEFGALDEHRHPPVVPVQLLANTPDSHGMSG